VPAAGAGERSIRWFVGTTIVVCWVGLGLNLLLRERPELLAPVMRYYWFRSSDAFAALGVAIALASMLAELCRQRRRVAGLWLAGAALLATIDTANQFSHLPFRVPGIHEATVTPRVDKNVAYDDWVAACEWIAEHTEPAEIVLTPRSSATLKWHTGRPEVATWKDVPQDARSIVEWWNRMGALHATGDSDRRWFKSFSELGAARLHQVMEKYDALYVIVPLHDDVEPLAIEPLYQNQSYAIYRRGQLDRQ
jgi:hypothetical protein